MISRLRLGISFLLILILAPGLRAASRPPVPLTGSVQSVDSTPPTPDEPHKPFISRRGLHANELTQNIDFEVVLNMQNFSELQQRIARGERISHDEMEARYYPTAENYQLVVAWLEQQGFTIRKQDPSRMAVFATGRVDLAQKAFSMTFGRVTQDGTEYTAATSAPVVPAELAAVVMGINGLQPFSRAHRHLVRKLSTTGAGAPFEPSQLAQAYAASSLYTYNISGLNQTIAIVIDTFPLQSDLNTFWSNYGVNRGTSTVSFIQVVSGTLAAPSGEESLDTEWSSSIAPGANVRVYATYDLGYSHLDEAYAQIYSDVVNSPSLAIHEMTMSYGGAEYYISHSQLSTDDQYFAELTAAGVTVFASTGDVGATPSSSSAAGGRHLNPEFPSSDPNVTAVGGTSISVDSNGNETSEVVWNNSYGATGGGISTYFAKPSWQTGTGVSSTSKRQVPDVASAADPDTGCYVVLNGSLYEYGGTSWSSPTWAGFCALFNQARANAGEGTLGLLGPTIYPYLGTGNFRDITSGNNIYDSTQGYSATTGYDLCTGLGAPDVTVLAKSLSGSTTLAPNLLSVASVKSHNGTAYPLPLPLTGSEGIECRVTGGTLELVFTFTQPVISGSASVTAGSASVGDVSFSGETMTVELDDVTDMQNLTVVVSGINGTTASDSVTFGVLLGDVNGDGIVSVLDYTTIRNDFNDTSGSSTFNPRADLNEDGVVSVLDYIQVRNVFNDQLP